jgi:asparagine synthetase B (glutamine-hydrolysing)
MFTFAIVDFAKDLLFAARDRAGEKLFYYYETDGEVARMCRWGSISLRD